MRKLYFLLIVAFAGCKKEGVKDYASAIVDKVWVGTFNYMNNATEYYSIHFKADSSFIFSDQSANWNGTWGINDNQLIIKLAGEIRVKISNDNKFVDIINKPTNDWELKTGELNDKFNESIDETQWKGTIGGDELVITFMPGSVIGVARNNVVINYGIYTRNDAGIRLDGWPSFGVIMPDGKQIKGGKAGSGEGPWSVTKL